MVTKELKEIINLLHKKYTYLIQDIPQLDAIEELPSNSLCQAQFLTEDLYNKKYILYVDPDIEQECLQFEENILFHEFTHMADSIKYNYLPFEEFQNFMHIYSEFHASEIQMDRMLETQEEKPYSLNQYIIHSGYITLKNWMDQTLNHIIEEFKLPEIHMPNQDKYDLIHLFYFIGYLRSLQKNNIFYEYDYSQIPQLKDCFNETTELLLTSQPDPKIIIPHYRKLETQIKNSLFEHKQTLLNNFSAKIEANFNDTMSDVITTLKECDPNFDEEEFLRNITGK